MILEARSDVSGMRGIWLIGSPAVLKARPLQEMLRGAECDPASEFVGSRKSGQAILFAEPDRIGPATSQHRAIGSHRLKNWTRAMIVASSSCPQFC